MLLSISSSFGIPYPEFNVVINNNPYPEDIFIHSSSTNQTQFMAIIDSTLDVKWHIVSTNGKGWDFKVNNNQKLTYFRKPSNDWTPSGGGVWHVLNRYMLEEDTLSCINDFKADYHDIQFTDSGGYLLQSYAKAEIDMPQTDIVDSANVLVIQEFDNFHNLIMEWKNYEHMDIQDYAEELNFQSSYRNWMHGNSIEIDDDENIIVSNRAMSEVIKFDRVSGELMWRLGGPMNDFTFLNDPLNGPNRQHDVRRLSNGNISIFDNGDSRIPAVTRVAEYQIDETLMTAELVWSYIHPNGYISSNQGSAQRLPNGNTLISWGGVAGSGQIITEVDYDGNIVLEIVYPMGNFSYKVRKNSWSFDIDLVRIDLNDDQNVDILDIIESVNFILSNQEPHPFHLYKIDLDNSGNIDILDIIDMANYLIQ